MITKAAVKFRIKDKEVIIPCHRHCDAFEILSILDYDPKDVKVLEQGFYKYTEEDKKLEFVNRKEAAKHAYECGQLKDSSETEHIETLFSEDLW